MAHFDHYRIETPEPIDIKFDKGDYIRKMTLCTKFSAYPSTGVLLGK